MRTPSDNGIKNHPDHVDRYATWKGSVLPALREAASKHAGLLQGPRAFAAGRITEPAADVRVSMAEKTELEILMEKHAAEAYRRGVDRGYADGMRDALKTMDRVLRETYIHADVSCTRTGGIVANVSAPGHRVNIIPAFVDHMREYPREYPPKHERITGPAHEVIPAAVRIALGLKPSG